MHPERIIPDETPPGIVNLHLKRYDFARRYAAGRQVLDLGCGAGYGTRYLAAVADHVVGIDISHAAVAYASARYGDLDNIRFVQGDAARLGVRPARFDVVCSFETIEHVPDVNAYLREVTRVLAPGGVFVVSTPCARRSTSRSDNPFHAQEWSASDFEQLLSRHFDRVRVFGQSRIETRLSRWLKRLDMLGLRKWLLPLGLARLLARLSGGRAMADLRLNDVLIEQGDLECASEIVAVASA